MDSLARYVLAAALFLHAIMDYYHGRLALIAMWAALCIIFFMRWHDE